LKITRYKLTAKEILESVKRIFDDNIKTVVLQSGEDDDLDINWLINIIKKIKKEFDIAITLSLGEKTYQEYKAFKYAGADRYLLKIETTNKNLYESFHINRSFENRLKCLDDLKKLGYQVGSGIMVGLKSQTLEDIANDILFFKQKNFDMIGINPFIPHADTKLARQNIPDVKLVLKVIALTRILTKNANMPATTALGSLDKDYRLQGLKCGANVLMPNYTPDEYKKFYEIYPNKK
jgi:biotin synthase